MDVEASFMYCGGADNLVAEGGEDIEKESEVICWG